MAALKEGAVYVDLTTGGIYAPTDCMDGGFPTVGDKGLLESAQALLALAAAVKDTMPSLWAVGKAAEADCYLFLDQEDPPDKFHGLDASILVYEGEVWEEPTPVVRLRHFPRADFMECLDYHKPVGKVVEDRCVGGIEGVEDYHHTGFHGEQHRKSVEQQARRQREREREERQSNAKQQEMPLVMWGKL